MSGKVKFLKIPEANVKYTHTSSHIVVFSISEFVVKQIFNKIDIDRQLRILLKLSNRVWQTIPEGKKNRKMDR